MMVLIIQQLPDFKQLILRSAASGVHVKVVSAGGRLAAQIVADGGRHIVLDVKSKNPLTYFTRAAKLRKVLGVETPTFDD